MNHAIAGRAEPVDAAEPAAIAAAGPPPWSPLRDPWRRRLVWGGVVLVALALLWTVAVGWVLPSLLRPRIEAQASAALGAPFTIDRLQLAPWSLRVQAQGVKLGPAEAPWFAMAEADAHLALESLWRLAPVIRRLTLTAPRIELERLAEGRYNITPLLTALGQRPPSPPDSAPARFAVHNIRVEDGAIHFVDRVGASEQRIEALRLGVPFLSTLPSDLAVDVEPLLDARVNGSLLHLDGRTRPFTAGQHSTIDVKWTQVDLTHWLAAAVPLLPDPLPATLQRGLLDLDLKIAFERRPAPAVPSLHITGTAALAQVQARLPARGLQAAWDSLRVEGLDLRPLERQAHIGSITLQAPQLDADLPTLLNPTPAASTAPVAPAGRIGPAAADPAAWQWRVDKLTVADGRVRLQDPAWLSPQALDAIQASVTTLSNAADSAAAFDLTLTAGGGEGQAAVVKATGTADLATRELKASLDLDRLQPAVWLAPWRAALPVRLFDGRLAAQAQLSASPAGWAVREGAAQITGLQLEPVAASALTPSATGKAPARPAAPAPTERLDVARIDISGIDVQSAEHQALAARIDAVRIDQLDLKGTRRSDGRSAWLPGPAPASATAVATAPVATPSVAPTWQLGELRCSNCAVAFTDQGVTPAATVVLSRTDLNVRKLGSDLRAALEFDLGTTVGPGAGPAAAKIGAVAATKAAPKSAAAGAAAATSPVSAGGRAKLSGTLRPQPLALRSRVELNGVDLGWLRPYLDPLLNLSLAAAKTSASGDLSLDGTARELVASARWRGRLALNDLRALDRLNDADFLRFKGLSLDAADLQWRAAGGSAAPAGIDADLGRVKLEGFYGRVIINNDGRINLRDILRNGPQDGARSLTTANSPDAAGDPPAVASAASPAAAASAAPASASASAIAAGPAAAAASPPSAPTPLRWRGIRLEGGQVDFTDNFIRPNYSARLTSISGDISALAWNDPQPAEVKIVGKVDDSAPLDISGTVHPLGARLQTDITAKARGIDITRLSAYSARYAGYGIDKGTLTATVHYRIDNGKLTAENQLYLDQLTFGQKVDSPDALKLPILLAVSLLKDRNGVIDINLPISGSLDDPQFSIAGLIGRVIVNLISKAITAPFALLGQVFGGAQQQLSHVGFEPGSAALGEPGSASLATLDTLSKALLDRPALKLEITGRADPAVDTLALRRAHVTQLLRAAKAKATGEALDEVRIDAVANPAERARWLEAAYKSADLKTRPRNAIGLLKDLPGAEMEVLLEQSAAAGPEQLRTLADRRADHVKAYLADKVPSERLLVTASRLDAAGTDDKSPPTQVSFALK